jgi:tetratricopeptide (TPR) repeat protein
MLDRRRAILLLVLPLTLATRANAVVRSTPVASGPVVAGPLDADSWLREAQDLWHVRRDFNGALKAFNQAVQAAPENATVRNERAIFFDTVRELVVPQDKQKFANKAREDWSWVARREPDSILGGVARDGLTRLDGKVLLPPKNVSCPAEAAAAHDRAESLYGAGKLGDAIPEYRKATDGCPAASIFWVNFADTYYGLEQYDKAKEMFERALVADPWLRSGHRFLADTEAKLGNADAALRQAELAVVSDPTYEAAWASLRLIADGTHREWNRVYSSKTLVDVDPASRKVTVTIPGARPTEKDSPEAADAAAWTAYGAFLGYAIGEGKVIETDAAGKPVTRSIDLAAMSALEIERRATRSTLQTIRETKKPAGRFWTMMARADAAGYLDEAIFLHMLDARLAAEYPAFREKDGGRLTAYLETLIAPRP